MQPQVVTQAPTNWSDIRSAGESAIHVAWQESNNGSYTVWYNTSNDNGQTWVGKNSLHSSTSPAVLSPLFIDSTGELHLLMATQEEPGSVTYTHEIWNAPQWSISDMTKFQTSSNDNISELLGAATTDGRLVMVYSYPVPSATDASTTVSAIFSSQRNFQETGQAAAPVATGAGKSTPAATLQPTIAPTVAATIVQATAPSLLAAPVTDNTVPVTKSEPLPPQAQYNGLILGIAVAILLIVIVTIFGIISVRRRGLH